jgi:hypothetical protein
MLGTLAIRVNDTRGQSKYLDQTTLAVPRLAPGLLEDGEIRKARTAYPGMAQRAATRGPSAGYLMALGLDQGRAQRCGGRGCVAALPSAARLGLASRSSVQAEISRRPRAAIRTRRVSASQSVPALLAVPSAVPSGNACRLASPDATSRVPVHSSPHARQPSSPAPCGSFPLYSPRANPRSCTRA